MPEYVLDTVVLQAMACSVPDGIDILLIGLGTTKACFPPEVYNSDETTLLLETPDDNLSEFARGLRYAARQARDLPDHQGTRYKAWLSNASQIHRHITQGTLFVEPLTVAELLRRETLVAEYGIGRGESACLTIAQRVEHQGVFVSADSDACRIAMRLRLTYVTLYQVIEGWILLTRPPRDRLDATIEGMRSSRFAFAAVDIEKLRRLL